MAENTNSTNTTSEILNGLEGIDLDYTRFMLPTERDFNIQGVDKTYIDKIQKYMDEAYVDDNSNKAAFYMETPPVTVTGSYSDNGIHFIKAKVCNSSLENRLNTFDGNTIPLKLSSIVCGDSANVEKIRNITIDNWAQFTERYGNAVQPDRFDVKLIGIDAPTLPRWGLDVFGLGEEIKTMTIKNLASQGDDYIWERSGQYKETDTLNFISIDNGKTSSTRVGSSFWHQCRVVAKSSETQTMEWLISDGTKKNDQYAQATKAKEYLLQALSRGDGYVYIVMDDVYLSRKAVEQLPTCFGGDIYGSGALNTLKVLADKLLNHSDSTTTGFNQFGLDRYGRALGSAYIRLSDGQWINLAKYIITMAGNKENSLQDLTMEKQVSDQFEVFSYDYKNRAYADAIERLSEETDDRWRIQAGILGKNRDNLRNWTVMLGDCLFMVPPTSIRSSTQTTSEKLPILRSRGCMIKSSTKAERMLELELYFHDDGINGVPLNKVQKTPSGEEVSYKMNGLRQLLAQFYFMPFLPVENKYINETLDIEAVSLVNMQISTIQGFPKLVKVALTLQEFDYRVYMPELPTHYAEDKTYRNYFASAINWPLARWYYQRSIMRGDIAAIDITKLGKVDQQKLCLKPMAFKNNKISFKLVSESHLKKMMQVKQETHKMVARGDTPLIKMSKGEQELATNVGLIAKAIDLGMLEQSYLQAKGESGAASFENAVKIIADKIQGVNGSCNTDVVQSITVTTTSDDSGLHGSIKVGVQADYLANTSEAISRLKTSASNYVQKDKGSFFKDGCLEISFIKKDGYTGLDPQNMSDYRFAVYCFNKEEIESDMDEARYSYPFLDYDYGNAIIENISASFGNVISRLGVSGSDGFAPQYLGAQNTKIEISFKTTDTNAVMKLNMLPRISSYYVREYRQVMSYSPIKISSEFTDMLGVSEVIVDNVLVETVPGQPGLYSINMKFDSVDRFMRRKEALKRIEGINDGYQKGESRIVLNTKNYFEIEETMKEAEIFPDLDLPQVSELKKSGFYFLRYVLDDKRAYPDPDFYFIYAHILSSEITRQSVLESVKEGANKQFSYDLKDKTGGQETTEPGKSGVTVTGQNTTAKAVSEQMVRVEKARKEAKEESDRLNKSEGVSVEDFIKQYSPTAVWNIGSDFIVSLMEPRFAKAMQTVKADDTKKQWLATVSKDMREAAVIIDNYLKEMPIEISGKNTAYEDLGKPFINYTEENVTINLLTGTTERQRIISAIEKMITSTSAIQSAFKKLHIDSSSNSFLSRVSGLMFCCAAANTGKEEYSEKRNKEWRPRSVAIFKEAGSQDGRYAKEVSITADTPLSDMAKVIEFGCFGIKDYDQNKLFSITGQWGATTGRSRYVIDPYYRNADEETLNTYKLNCILNVEYCARAFFRNMLYWLTTAVDETLLPSVSYDVMRDSLEAEIKAINAADKTLKDGKNTIEKHLQFLKNNSYKIDAGKFFMVACLALSNGDKAFMKKLRNRDYQGLGGLVQGCSSTSLKTTKAESETYYIRRLILALIGEGFLKSHERLTDKIELPAAEAVNEELEKKYLEAAEDPMQYGRDSFYDMVTTDMRGRMARAFPVIYMLFIDEGREIGAWKLHDNFYQTNAISEIQVVKNRKNPADTASIVLSNMFGTYNTEDENTLINYEADYFDVFRSIFSPREQFLKDEAKRRSVAPARRAKLEPGTRIHLRMGYGSNAARLPIVFNGMIAEVEAGECVQIIAQSDGVELMHQIMNVNDENSLLDQDKFIGTFFRNGASPKEIMTKLFVVKGGFLKKTWAASHYIGSDWAYMNNKNPYGLFHFGDPEYKEIFASGEVMQNVYEAMSRPCFKASTTSDDYLGSAAAGAGTGAAIGIVASPLGSAIGAGVGATVGTIATAVNDSSGETELKGIREEYALGDESAPRISCDVNGKTVWDVLNICRSVSPDYMLGVVPFGFRSSLFHGASQYYYAFDYDQMADGVITEKRKPYQQWHILSSFSDIIKNGITASAKDVRTCAVGLYKRGETFGTETTQTVGPMWVDFDIYPEDQKTITVDTQLFGQQTPFWGRVVPFLDTMIDNMADEKGSVQSPYAIAWRMTASALKETVTSMYKGELVIIGDPSIKPHDRIFIGDLYEHMNGQCLVRDVVHNFSLDSGFSTVITPDAIAVVDDPQELNRQMIFGMVTKYNCMLQGLVLYAAAAGLASAYKPALMNTASVKKIGEISSAIKGKIVGSETLKTIISKGGSTAKSLLNAKNAATIVKGASTATRVGGTLAAGAGLAAAALPVTISIIAGWAICTTLSALVSTAVERWAKNLQVMQIFPLSRNGMVLTAGVNGSMGLVYGSPTYKTPGTFKSILSSISKTSEMPVGFSIEGVESLLISLCLSDELLDVCSKYQRDNGIIDDYGSPVADEQAAMRIVNNVNSSQMMAYNSVLKHAMVPKVATSDEMKKAVNLEGIPLGGRMLSVNQRIVSENYPIITHPYLIKQFQDGFFHILHEECSVDESEGLAAMVEGKQRNLRVIKETKNGNVIYDIPVLKEDARNYLALIVKKTRDITTSWQGMDQRENKKDSFIVIKSALRVGESLTAASTGRVFLLEGRGECKETLPKAIQEILNKNNEINEKTNGLVTKNVFLVEEQSKNGDIKIIVKMDKVNGLDEKAYNAFPPETVAPEAEDASNIILRPSNSHMWINCPPSASKQVFYKDGVGEAAREGTVAHALAAWKIGMLKGLTNSRPDMTAYDNAEMEAATDGYCEYVKGILAEAKKKTPNATLLIEQNITLPSYITNKTGTTDCAILAGQTVYVIDFKYGENVVVNGVDNSQMRIYALALLDSVNTSGVTNVVNAIYQPRLGRANPVSSETITVGELRNWGLKAAAPAAKLAVAKTGVENAGEWCIFCRGKHGCGAWRATRPQ